MAHAVAVWSRMAGDLLDQPTMRDRGAYWKNVCTSSVAEHAMIATRLQLIDPLPAQKPLMQWATLPAWPVGERTTAPGGDR
ncbi:hypothetical protein [Micromonospora coerulea]|uniref:hypothetical protein n=1 Tax=Micromonospora coerulea TaxID=47856 RepID=UPI001903C4A5|nr:hypothetical protein [Micromonospora veneta]